MVVNGSESPGELVKTWIAGPPTLRVYDSVGGGGGQDLRG